MASMILGVTLVVCIVGWVVAAQIGERESAKNSQHPFWRRGEYFSTDMSEEEPEE